MGDILHFNELNDIKSDCSTYNDIIINHNDDANELKGIDAMSEMNGKLKKNICTINICHLLCFVLIGSLLFYLYTL